MLNYVSFVIWEVYYSRGINKIKLADTDMFFQSSRVPGTWWNEKRYSSGLSFSRENNGTTCTWDFRIIRDSECTLCFLVSIFLENNLLLRIPVYNYSCRSCVIWIPTVNQQSVIFIAVYIHAHDENTRFLQRGILISKNNLN